MPQFHYKARQSDGTIVTGSLETVDRRQATLRLKEQGLTPVSLSEAEATGKAGAREWLQRTRDLFSKNRTVEANPAAAPVRGETPRRERTGLVLLKRLLELHGSGLPIGDSIRILSQRLSDPELKQLAVALWRDLSEGATLAVAMTRQSRYFSASVAFVIEAGEATGNLTPVLNKVVEHLEEKYEIRKRMVASMAYPAFICTVAFAVVILFLVYLLPQIQNMLDRLGGEMTWSARILIDGSHLLLQIGPFVLIALVVAALSLRQWRKTEAGRNVTDGWAIKLPLAGGIFYYSDLFQAGNLISTLLDSGINTTETLRLTERAIRNVNLRERFHTARNQVNEGLSVAQAFKRNEFMPDLAIDILTVGENTGNLSRGMDEITRSFRNELTKRLTRLTNIVSSGALVCAFALVALIAIGIVTSIFQVSRTLSG